MKVVYSVPVVGALRTEHSLRFSLDGREIDLICGKGGLLERVIYTVKSDAEAYGPKIEVHEDRNPRVHIIEQLDPNLQRAIQELHNLEANLSMFGVEGFDFDFAEVRWIPETDPEKQHVHVLGVKREPDGVVPPSEITPPSLLASIYLHCLSSYDLEIPLTFFRKGDSLFRERRYLEALPNFLFLVEYLFADGKFRTKEVVRQYRRAQPLTDAIQFVLHDAGDMGLLQATHAEKFRSLVQGKSIPDIIDWIVALRGYMSHQSKKDGMRWHPSRHEEWELECKLMRLIAHRVCMEEQTKIICTQPPEWGRLRSHRVVDRSATPGPTAQS